MANLICCLAVSTGGNREGRAEGGLAGSRDQGARGGCDGVPGGPCDITEEGGRGKQVWRKRFDDAGGT